MEDLEKTLEKQVSRRSFLKTTGIGLGVAAGALVFGTGVVGAQTNGAKPVEIPLPYVELDPEEARLRAHAGFYLYGCGYGSFYAILSMLREKVGGPYNNIPSLMTSYAGAGVAYWGTLCGALNGACAAINLACPVKDTKTLSGELLGWYTKFSFPSEHSTALSKAGAFKYTTKNNLFKGEYLKIDLPGSVSDSPLCHVSCAKWIAKSGFGYESNERKERCARLTADCAAKAVELLNAWKAGKFIATYKVDDETASCLSCHEDDQEGLMSCTSCHEPH